VGRGEGDKTGGAIGSILSSLTGGLITSGTGEGEGEGIGQHAGGALHPTTTGVPGLPMGVKMVHPQGLEVATIKASQPNGVARYQPAIADALAHATGPDGP